MTNFIPTSISITFLLLVGTTLTAAILTLKSSYQNYPSTKKHFPLVVLLLTFILHSTLSATGFFANTIGRVPPPAGMALVVLLSLTLYFAIAYKPFQQLNKQSTIQLAYLQSFRFPLELIFIWLLEHNAIPIEMTFEGRNPDILIGISAPLVAYAVQKKWLPMHTLLIWNLIGLGFLLNIMTVAVLCLPTAFRQLFDSLPNEFVLHFPFNLIPAVLVMMALFLHILSIRTLLRKAN